MSRGGTLSTSPPARGTRPANRRDLILVAATDLFATRGYENVNVADVADRVAVGPSALYRHFRGKESLLEAVVERAGDSLLEAAGGSGADLVACLRALAGASLDNRSLGVLWRREARHLPTGPRERLEDRVGEVRRRLAERIRALRPADSDPDQRLVLIAVLGVLLSPSFHRVELPRERFVGLLAEAALNVLHAPGSELPPVTAPRPGRSLGRSVRREVVLRVALDLFAEKSYAAVGMNDIAAAAGLATSTVYLDFPGKADLLATALHRGNGYLQVELDRALDEASDESEALCRLVASHCRFAFAHSALVDLLITETRTLPEPDRLAITQAQRDYVQEWARLYRTVRPELDDAASTVVVQAILQLMNDLARAGGDHVEGTARRLAVAGLLGS